MDSTRMNKINTILTFIVYIIAIVMILVVTVGILGGCSGKSKESIDPSTPIVTKSTNVTPTTRANIVTTAKAGHCVGDMVKFDVSDDGTKFKCLQTFKTELSGVMKNVTIVWQCTWDKKNIARNPNGEVFCEEHEKSITPSGI